MHASAPWLRGKRGYKRREGERERETGRQGERERREGERGRGSKKEEKEREK